MSVAIYECVFIIFTEILFYKGLCLAS